jgi:hypothetical protein
MNTRRPVSPVDVDFGPAGAVRMGTAASDLGASQNASLKGLLLVAGDHHHPGRLLSPNPLRGILINHE